MKGRCIEMLSKFMAIKIARFAMIVAIALNATIFGNTICTCFLFQARNRQSSKIGKDSSLLHQKISILKNSSLPVIQIGHENLMSSFIFA